MQRRYPTRSARSTNAHSSSYTVWLLILSWVVIWGGLIYLFWGGDENKDTDNTDQLSGSTLVKRVIGEKVVSAGTLTQEANFDAGYTHTFENEKGEQFGAKSSLLALQQYSGEVQVKGEIVDIQDELPILRIDEIVTARTEQEPLDGANTAFYYFAAPGLGIDLSISKGYGVKQEGESIILYDKEWDNESILNITPFVCTAQDPIKDCTTLKRNFIEFENDSFVGSQGNTFYNLGETNTWVTFAHENWGYYIVPKSQQALLDFAHLLVFMNEDTIKKQAMTQAPLLCRTIDQTLTTPTTAAITYPQKSVAQIAIVGTTAQGQQVSCTLSALLGATMQFRLETFSPTQPEQAIEQEVFTASVEDRTPPDALQPSNTGSAPTQPALSLTPPTIDAATDTSGWLTYASVRGYTVYFSSHKISWAGEILSEWPDLGIPWLRCWYKINLAQWANADSIDTAPEATIYECMWSPSSAQLQANNLTSVGTASSGQVFYMQYYTPSLKDVQVIVK